MEELSIKTEETLKKKVSKLSIASLIFLLLPVLMYLITIIVVRLFVKSTLFISIASNLVTMVTFVSPVIALSIAVFDIRKKDRNKILSIIVLVICGLLILAFLVSTIYDITRLFSKL